MEYRIDWFQGPILVENDAAAEKPWPIKDDAVVVQKIKQGFFIANPTHFVTKAVKLGSFQQPVLAFGRFAHGLVRFSG